MFDSSRSDDGTVTILLPPEDIRRLPRQSLVRILSPDDRRYLGALVSGPFAEPDGLPAESPALVAVTVRGGVLLPRYHGRAQVQLIGEELAQGTVPPRRRPLPNSLVEVLDDAATAAILRSDGPIRIGVIEGRDNEIEVRVPLAKSVFPRHLGILGTTGAGKSTTVSGLVSQFQTAGVATIILDTEGEYGAINEPTADPAMLRSLERRGGRPGGIPNTHLLHLVGRDVRNPAHPDRTAFSLRFSELSPYTVIEILGLNDAQQERFLKAYDIAKAMLERCGVFPRRGNAQDQSRLLDHDEYEEGYPELRLDHVYDVVLQTAAEVNHDADPDLHTEFRNERDFLKQQIQAARPAHVFSWRAVLGRLNRLRRMRIFDRDGAGPGPRADALDYSELLRAGHVSLVDLSDTDSPQLRNLAIAEILRGVQKAQEDAYERALQQDEAVTPVMILIEEAHEFLSAQRIAKMPVLFEQVARIARRGRKRWLGLVFITQLPQHLPDEVLGLINNWVLHKISDAGTVARLRRSIGGIEDGLWSLLPGLAPGQAVVSFTSLTRPLTVAIDATPCRLLLID
jgi:DNA helicase HerA-like ATPase